MRMQFFKYRTGKTLTNGETWRDDLPNSGYLSSIYLFIYGAGVTDAFNALEKWRIMDYISSIKIVTSGNETLKSLTGRCLRGCMTDDGYPPIVDQEFNYGSSTKRWHSWINFGRMVGDMEYGLDLSQYDNTEIQVTSDAADAQFASDLSVDVYLGLLRDVGGANPFRGYLKTEEYRKIKTAQSGVDYVDLPTIGKLRRMLIQVDPTVSSTENANRNVYSTLNNVKMTFRDGAEEHINCNPRHIWFMANMLGRQVPIVGHEAYHSNGQGVRTGLGQTLYKAFAQMPQGGTAGANTVAWEPGNDGHTQKLLRSGTDNYSGFLMGHGPENCFSLPFNYPEDTEENYLDLAREKTVQLELETGSNANDASATYRVLLDRIIQQ